VQAEDEGKHIRLGIYADDNLDGYPDRLVLDAGVVDLDTTGVKTIAIDQHLPAGLYFLALLTDSAGVKLWMENTPLGWSPLGSGSSPGLPCFTWKAAYSYGALPATFPAGAADMNDLWGLSLRVVAVD